MQTIDAPSEVQSEGYPAEQIGDFIHQLLWELRGAHFLTISSGVPSEEVESRLKYYLRRYKTPLLNGPGTDRANGRSQTVIRAERDEQLLHLEAVLPLIHKALLTARMTSDFAELEARHAPTPRPPARPREKNRARPRHEATKTVLARHIGELCREHNVPRINKFSMQAAYGARTYVHIPPVTDWITYFKALHRIGQHVTRQSGRDRYLVYSNEARAWQWALDNTLVQTDDTIRTLIRLSLRQVLSSETTTRKGRPPAGHPFSRLLVAMRARGEGQQ